MIKPESAYQLRNSGLDALSFVAGKGTPFITWPGARINDATTTKQTVNAGTGLVVLASDESANRYYHAELALGVEPRAFLVYGDIGRLWQALGAERGIHGAPRSDELSTPDGRGRFNDFTNGGIYWTSQLGARSTYGAIYAKWASLRWEAGLLGFPLTNESGTPDGVGRFNHFEGGSMYWTTRTGAYEVHGAIRDRWRDLGWERSYLGYPTSDEYSVAGGRRSDFQGGSITWDARTG